MKSPNPLVEDYCDMLEVATTRAEETMPLRNKPPLPFPTFYGDRRNLFSTHITYLKTLCDSPANWGEDVFALTVDDVSVLSPPSVEGPVYTCTNSVRVIGVLPGASVELFRRNSSGVVTSQGVETGGPQIGLTFVLPWPADNGDAFWAVQTLGAQTSGPGIEELTGDYTEAELPQPRITQPVYACADKIGVHTELQGVDGRIWKNTNGGSSTWVPVPGTWNSFSPPRTPWSGNDTFHAETRLCATKGPVVSVPASPMPATPKPGRFWGPPGAGVGEIYTGQEYLLLDDLDNGAFASVSLVGSPGLALGDTSSNPEGETVWLHLPTSPLGGYAQLGQKFSAVSRFACNTSTTGTQITSSSVLPCSSLPAPKIAFPRQGDRFITVLTFVPGARIRVYRASTGAEIADGAGPRVMLAPPNVLGFQETIRVVQQLGTCLGTQAFEVTSGSGQ